MAELSFLQARERVRSAIQDILRENLESIHPSCSLGLRVQRLICLNLGTAFILVVSAAVDRNFRKGFVFSAALVLVLIIINVLLQRRYASAEITELAKEMEVITDEYVASLAKYQNALDPSPREKPQGLISSGHSHVSIIAVFRDGQWQRIPSLLLVEGDIISLMAGDSTPGSAYELISDRICTSQTNGPDREPLNGSTKKNGWRRGRLLEKGSKVLLRAERKKYSPQSDSISEHEKCGHSSLDAPEDPRLNQSEFEMTLPILPALDPVHPTRQESSEKHKQSRAINSQSVELLTLSGDMRCFLMAETPILDFCKEVLQRSSTRGPSSDSFVRTLFLYVVDEGFRLMFGILILLTLAVILRMSLLPEANESQVALVGPIRLRLSLPPSPVVSDPPLSSVDDLPIFFSDLPLSGTPFRRSPHHRKPARDSRGSDQLRR
jgi:hypothetical protein